MTFLPTASWIIAFAAPFALALSPTSSSAEDLTNCRAGWRSAERSDTRAIELFDRCVSTGQLSNATLSRTYRNIGITYRRAGDSARAIEMFSRAFDLAPNDPWNDFVNRGNSWSDRDMLDEALRWTTESLIGNIYSTSFLSRAALGQHVDDFETDLLGQLVGSGGEGTFTQEATVAYELARLET